MSTEEVTALQDLIAGGVAGSISVIVGHPFDTYKVRLQTTSAPLKSASLSGASPQSSQTYASSLRCLYRGIGSPLSTAAVVNALVFSNRHDGGMPTFTKGMVVRLHKIIRHEPSRLYVGPFPGSFKLW